MATMNTGQHVHGEGCIYTYPDCGTEDAMEPMKIDLVRELREALGMFAGAMPLSPAEAWDEAIQRVLTLAQGRCATCVEREETPWYGSGIDPSR